MSVVIEAQRQDSNIQGGRRGEGTAVAIDTTARAYDLRGLIWNGQKYYAVYQEFVFLDLQNDGDGKIYYYFSPTNTVDLNEATIQAAGSTLANTLAVPKVIRGNTDAPARIQRDKDLFLIVKGSAASTLRIFPSSDSSPQAQ